MVLFQLESREEKSSKESTFFPFIYEIKLESLTPKGGIALYAHCMSNLPCQEAADKLKSLLTARAS